MFCEALGELQRRGASDAIFEERVELGLECGVGFGEVVGALEFEERDHESFGDVAAAVGAESSGGLGGGGGVGGPGWFLESLVSDRLRANGRRRQSGVGGRKRQIGRGAGWIALRGGERREIPRS